MAQFLRPLGLAVTLASAQWALPAAAQYLEETALPNLEAWGTEVGYDAPVAVPGGQRWNNVTLRPQAS